MNNVDSALPLTLQVLVSTCNKRAENLGEALPIVAGIGYVVVHQCFDGNAYRLGEWINRPDVVFISSSTKGLSRSRNIALAAATAPYVLLADDDVAFRPAALFEIANDFQRIQTDILSFRFEKVIGADNVLAKKYPEDASRITGLKAMKVSSVELAMNLRSVRESNLQFDERFGLGAQYPGSEENIFISDALKRGLKIHHCERIILVHPDESTGDSWNEESAKARGALFKRIFGISGIFLLGPFMFKHRVRISRHHSFSKMLLIAHLEFFKFSS